MSRVGCVLAGLVALQGAALCTGTACAQSMASRFVATGSDAAAESAEYRAVQARLARGWNTWDVHSVTTQVLLPEGLAIHVGMKRNTTLNGDAYLGDVLIGRMGKNDEW